jgi:predicted nucleic acid-binding protein
VFIDSNIPMYVAGREHPHRDASRRFLARVQRGEVAGVTSTEVLQEILYRYAALGRRDLAGQVYDLFVRIVPEVLPVTLADTDRARALVGAGAVGVRDAVHAAVMFNNDIRQIATFDAGFDGMEGVERVELA